MLTYRAEPAPSHMCVSKSPLVHHAVHELGVIAQARNAPQDLVHY